jgi:hypothetical protein
MGAFVVTAQGFWGELDEEGIDAASLASLLLGDTSLAALHRAGLVEESHPGAVPRASAMFSRAPRPWLNHMF